MLSASHNPYQDNGIKPFLPSGEKLTDADEQEIESFIDTETGEQPDPDAIGTVSTSPELLESYIDSVTDREFKFDGRVVIDCANGGTSVVDEGSLKDCIDDPIVIHHQPDGKNINQQCGSLNLETLGKAVRNHDAEVGFAFDGDGDRVLAVNNEGEPVNGDVLMYGLARYQFGNDGKEDGLVITVMSNFGLREALRQEGISWTVVGVGDQVVYEELHKQQWSLGGEQSGHVIDRDWLPTGDGLHTMLNVLQALSERSESLKDWDEHVPEYPQVLNNVEVPEKPSIDGLKKTRERIQSVEHELEDQGRVLVRYSGTEPVARVMVEGPDQNQIEQYSKTIGDCLKQEIIQQQGEPQA